jgi:hypothetical protein
MIAVLAEDRTDAESLATIVRRIQGNPRATVLKKGFSGGGELCRKGASFVRTFADRGASRFVLCHDADGPDPEPARLKVKAAVVDQSEHAPSCCIVVPVQELEAWFIADELALTRTIPSLTIRVVPNPESIESPKEWLVRESRQGRSRPLYAPQTFNPKVAEHIDLEKVARKCPSFRPLLDFVRAS